MSTTIDERVVEMRFDANQFNNNIDTSIQSINKLNTSIDNMSTGKGLLNLSKAAEKVDFSKTEWAATHAGFHIEDVFEKATRFLENNIASRLVNFGTNIGKSLTIEPVFTGFNEYEQKMGSVQTIMNGANVTLEETMNTLEELNTYADKTIYSFGDMTNSIGKFVNAGVPLKDAVEAIKGISNEAAVSGATAAEAGRAMYNIAQALSTGSMKLIDWKSIENANMATMEFKKTLIETGAEMNAIRDGENTSISKAELLADPSKFRASIEGVKGQTWVTDKVMIEALRKYADETTEFGKKAYAAAQDVKTFTMLMDTLKEAAQSGWAVSMENIIGNFEEAKQMWTAVNNEIGGLLDKSSKARNDLLEGWKKEGRPALLNSIGNIWFTIKDTIIGVKEAFRDVFPAMTSKQLIGMTKGLEEFTKRIREFMADAKTMGTIKNIFSGFFKAINSIKSAIAQFWSAGKSIFGNITKAFTNIFSVTKEAEGISSIFVKMGNAIGTFGQKVNEFFTSSKNSENIVKIFEGIFSAVDLLRKGLVTLWNVASAIISPLLGGASGIGSALLEIAADIASFVTALNGGTEALSDFGSIAGKIKDIAVVVIDAIKGIFDPSNISGDAFGKIKEIFTGLFDKFSLPKIDFNSLKVPEVVINSLTSLKDTLSSVFNSLTKNLQTNDVLKPIFNFYTGLSNVLNGVLGVVSSLLNAIKSIFDGFANMMNTAPFLTISMLFNNILNIINLLNTGFAMGSITQTFQKLAGVLDNFGDAFEGWLNESLAKAAKNFAISIAIVAAALVVLSTIEPDRLLTAVLALTAVAYGLRRAITGLSGIKFEGVESFKKGFSQLGTLSTISTSVIKFAAAILIVALALKSIGDLDIDNLVVSTLAIVVIAQALVKVANALVKTSSSMNRLEASNLKKIGFALLEFAIGIRVLASAIKVVGEMKLEDIVTGLIAIAIAMAGLTQVAKKLGEIDSKTIGKTAFALLSFSVAVRLIASAVTSIGQLGIEGVIAGLIGISVILGELVFAAKILGESQASMKAAGVLLALAVSIAILGNAISKFGNMSSDQLTQGMYAIIVAVGAMLGIARLLPEEFNKSAVAMLACAVALNIVANAAERFGNMKFTDMLQGILGLAAGMAIMAVGLRFMQGSISGAIAMIIVSAGLVIFAQALKTVGELSLGQLAKGLIGIAVALIILGVAMAAMTGLIPGAVALLIASVGLIAISGALLMLSAIPFTSLLSALFGLAAAIAVFAVAAALCTPLLIPMAGLALVLMLLAGSVAIVGAGLYLIAEAIAVLSTNGIAGVLLLEELSVILLGLIPISLVASVTITALAVALVALTVGLVAFGAALIIVGAALAVVGVGLVVLAAGLTAIAVAAVMCAAAFAAITGNLDGLSDVLGSFSGDFLNAGKQLMTSFINGIKGMASKAWDAVKGVGKSITSKFKSFFGIGENGICQDAYDAGKSVGDSYSKGLEESQPAAEKKAETFSNDVTKEYEDKFDEQTKETKVNTNFSLTDGSKKSLSSLTDSLDISSIMGGETDIGSLIGGNVDLNSLTNADGLNNSLTDTKKLTGDSALNLSDMNLESANTEDIMKSMNLDTSDIAANTGDMSANLGDISNMDFSNTEILSEANLDGLTDSKQLSELTKTKDAVDAINESVDDADDKTLKINVDATELEKIAKEIEKGKWGNGKERVIKLANAGYTAEDIAGFQNKVNEDLGSSVRHIADDYADLVKSVNKTIKDQDAEFEKLRPLLAEKMDDRYLDMINSIRERGGTSGTTSIPSQVFEDAWKQKNLYMANLKNEMGMDKYMSDYEKQLFEEQEKNVKKIADKTVAYVHYTGRESAEELEKQAQEYRKLGNEVKFIFDVIPSANTAKRLLNVDVIPSSDKDQILKIISEDQKLTNLWNETIEERHLSMTKGAPASYRNEDEYDYAGSIGAKDPFKNSEVLKEARNRAKESKESKEIAEKQNKHLNNIESSTKEIAKDTSKLNLTDKGYPSSYDKTVYKSNLTDSGYPSSVNKENNKKQVQNSKMMESHFQSSFTKDTTEKDAEKVLGLINLEKSLKTTARGAGKVWGDHIKKSVAEELSSGLDSMIGSNMDVSFQKAAKNSAKGGFKNLLNSYQKEAKPIDVEVKTNANKATQQVKTLNETAKQTKDKKITVSADTKAATTAVTEFSNGLKKMSTTVDAETGKTKQVFSRFYTAIQQTINTYTPMVVANFKSTFQMAINSTLNYLRSGSIISEFRTVGVNISKGLVQGIKSQAGAVKEAAASMAKSTITAAKKTLNEHSPSVEFDTIGYNAGIGMANGMMRSMASVQNASSHMSGSAITAANTTVDGMNNAFGRLNDPLAAFVDTNNDLLRNMRSIFYDALQTMDMADYETMMNFYNAIDDPWSKMEIQLKYVEDNLRKEIEAMGLNFDEIIQNANVSPTITPVVDMTNVNANAGAIDALFNQQQASNIALEFNNSQQEQQVHDQQMADQMAAMNANLSELVAKLDNQEPTPVDVNVTLEGDAKSLFTAMRNQNKDYYRRTGKYAFQ